MPKIDMWECDCGNCRDCLEKTKTPGSLSEGVAFKEKLGHVTSGEVRSDELKNPEYPEYPDVKTGNY